MGWDQAAWDVGRVWRSVLEPHIASTDGTDTDLSVFGRHPEVSEQVWSGQVGYPADGRYLEFHKKHGSGPLVCGCVQDFPGHPTEFSGSRTLTVNLRVIVMSTSW